MKQKFLKLGMLAFTALMLTYCQREEFEEKQPEEPIAAVDPQTVVSWKRKVFLRLRKLKNNQLIVQAAVAALLLSWMQIGSILYKQRRV